MHYYFYEEMVDPVVAKLRGMDKNDG